MFNLKINLRALPHFPAGLLAKKLWPAGIEFKQFRHRRVESALVYCEELLRLAIIVREADCRAIAFPAEMAEQPHRLHRNDYKDVVQNHITWPLNAVVIEISYGDNPAITLQRSPYATVAIYVAKQNDQLVASWDPLEVVNQLPALRVDLDQVARFIDIIRPFNMSRTAYEDLYRLQPNTKIIYAGTSNSPKFDNQKPPELLLHRALPNADIVHGFEERLQESLRCWQSEDKIAVELSGGLDSASVAFAAKGCGFDHIDSFAIELHGETGIQQRARRHELCNHLNAQDHVTRGEDYLPLAAPFPQKWGFRFIFDDMVDVNYGRALVFGYDTIHSGNGGDELGLPDPNRKPVITDKRTITNSAFLKEEHADWPQGTLSESMLNGPQTASYSAMRRGLWMTAPLAMLHVAEYCIILPTEYRQGRFFMKSYLQRQGMTMHWLSPKLPENFDSLITAALPHILGNARRKLRQSLLAEAGLIDRKALHSAIEHCESSKDILTARVLFNYIQADDFLGHHLQEKKFVANNCQ